MGSQLRHHYVHQLGFLSAKLNPDDIYLQSTNYVRTIESLLYLLHGLYPHSYRPQHPLFVLVKPDRLETMTANYSICPSLCLDTITSRNKLVAENIALVKKALESVQDINVIQDAAISNQIYRFYDMLASFAGNKIPFPKGVTVEHYRTIENAQMAIWYFNLILGANSIILNH